MEITIGEPVRQRYIPTTYSVAIELMGGDADYDAVHVVDGFRKGNLEDEVLLEDLLRLLSRLGEVFPNGRTGQDYYSSVEGILPHLDLQGQWSLDIMLNDNEGEQFYAIDMAPAETSAFSEHIPEGKRRKTPVDWIPNLASLGAG